MTKANSNLNEMPKTLASIENSMALFFKQQADMIENYGQLLQNQGHVVENHDIVVENQKTIIKNQGIITHNQSSIINNQGLIVKNQAYLKTIINSQIEILSALTNTPRGEISKKVDEFLENAKTEMAEQLRSGTFLD